jgi:hypothetical protein
LAGIQAIDVPGVENVSIWGAILVFLRDFHLSFTRLCVQCNLQVDVTELVDGHSSYLSAAQQILEHLELNTYYPVFVPLSAANEETDGTVAQ